MTSIWYVGIGFVSLLAVITLVLHIISRERVVPKRLDGPVWKRFHFKVGYIDFGWRASWLALYFEIMGTDIFWINIDFAKLYFSFTIKRPMPGWYERYRERRK